MLFRSESFIPAAHKSMLIKKHNAYAVTITGGLKESEIPLNRRITCIQQMYTKTTIGKRQEVQSMAC